MSSSAEKNPESVQYAETNCETVQIPDPPPSSSENPSQQILPPPMMQGIQPLTGLKLSAKDKAVNWKVYKQQWENYSIIAQLDKQTEEYRVALFLYSVGPDAVKIYNSFDLSDENRRKLSKIIKEFDNFAIGETNETYERYVFDSRDQKEGESIDDYVGELRTLAQTCNFCTCLHDTLIRDRIVLGLRDGGTRKRLLRQGKLTLQKCIEIGKSDEVSNTQLKNMDQTTQEPEDVHKVKMKKPKKPEREYPKQTVRDNPNRKPNDDKTSDRPCDFCGRKHCKGRTNCTAWGRICGACGKKYHFVSQCRAREKTHNVEFQEDETSEEEFLYCVTSKQEMTGTVNSISEREIYAQMLINEKPIKFHIDCDATVNVLPSKYVNKEDIQPTKRVLQMWNKAALKPEGICRVTVRNPRNQKKYSVEFIIVKENLTPLLGAAVIQQMGLIEVHEENF